MAITEDEDGVAAALADRLRAEGAFVRVVKEEDGLADVQAVICLHGLRPLGDHAAHERAAALNFACFRVARAVAPRFAREGGTFITVQDTGGDFGLSGSPRAWVAAASALARTAAVEWPHATVRSLDLERGGRSAEALAQALAQELLAGGIEPEIGLRADGRRVRTALRHAPLPEHAHAPAEALSFVVATGGARGVTASCLLQLARQAPARLLLLGRTPLDAEPTCSVEAHTESELKRALALAARARGDAPDLPAIARKAAAILAARQIRASIQALEALGTQVHYAACDATDPQAVSQAIDERRSAWGPVTALVHGAGVLADKLIGDKTDAQYERVMRTKVQGLQALLAATAQDPLRLMILFSSVAARSGNLGQCDYAMANEVLNKVALHERRRRGAACTVRAIGWGPWDGGMVDDGLRARFAAMGVGLIPVGAGARAFCAECGAGADAATEVVLGVGEAAPGLAGDATRATLGELAIGRSHHGFLDGHRIKGVPVVPVALVLEWFAAAARTQHPALRLVALRNVRVLRGLRLPRFDEGHDELVRIRVRPSAANGGELDLELLASDGGRLYAAIAELGEETNTEAEESTPPSFEASSSLTADAVYGRAPLFHGPSFQMLERVDALTEGGLAARARGVEALGWSAEAAAWHTDPALIDAALQLALLWTHQHTAGISLPTGIERVSFLAEGPLEANVGLARAVLRGRRVSAHRCESEVCLWRPDGTPLMKVTGIETHVIPTTEAALPPVNGVVLV